MSDEVIVIPSNEPEPQSENPTIERDLGYALAKVEALEMRAALLETGYREMHAEQLRMHSESIAAAKVIENQEEEEEEKEEEKEEEEEEEEEEATSVEAAAAAEALAAASIAQQPIEPIKKKRGFISLFHN